MSKRPDRQEVTNRDVNATQRASLAVRLRAQKLTYEQIAAEAGYANAGTCRKAIMRELQRCVVKDVDELRMQEAYMLDTLHAAVWPMAVPPPDAKDEKGKPRKPNLFAVDRVIAISERRAKLLGLDTPVSVANVAANQIIVREIPAQYLTGPEAKG